MSENTVIDGTEVSQYEGFKIGDMVEYYDGFQIEKHVGKINYIVIGRTSGKAFFGIGVYGNIRFENLLRKVSEEPKISEPAIDVFNELLEKYRESEKMVIHEWSGRDLCLDLADLDKEIENYKKRFADALKNNQEV